MPIIAWFDQHSGAVQAGVGVVTALLAGVVARLTWRYVNLTSAIAISAATQTEIARLQADTSLALKAAAEEQAKAAATRERSEEARRASEYERAKKHFSGLCARFLAHFSAASGTGPVEGFFRNAPPIDDAEISLFREAGLACDYVEPEFLEGMIMALNVMRDLQSKTRAVAANYGYAYNSNETRMYVSNLQALRGGLERFTRFRPAVQA